MLAPDLICASCETVNPIHRIWCCTCEAPLPKPDADALQSEALLRDRKRKALYEEVLRDLGALAKEGSEIDVVSCTVRSFYEKRIASIKAREAEASRESTIFQALSRARAHAIVGEYPKAISVLKTGLVKEGDATELKLALDEVLDRYDRKLASRAARKAGELIAKARQSLSAGRLEEATRHITEVKAMKPGSQVVLLAIAEIDHQIRDLEQSEVNARSVEAKAVEQNEAEQVLMATLVDTGTVSSADTVPVADVVEEAVSVVTSSATDPKIGTEVRTPERDPRTDAAPTPERRTFLDKEDVPDAQHRMIEAASQWSSVFKPFLIDNVGWFVGAFSVIAGFALLIVTFWSNIEQNRILMHSLVYLSLAVTTGLFFYVAYFMRTKYPQLESSSNVLLVIVTLLIPLVFAAAVLTSLIPLAPAEILLPVKVG